MEKEIHKWILPARNPEQIVFQRREDGYYDVTIKVDAVDPKDNMKEITVYEKCIAMLPDWISGMIPGIPLEMVKQESGELYNLTAFPKD